MRAGGGRAGGWKDFLHTPTWKVHGIEINGDEFPQGCVMGLVRMDVPQCVRRSEEAGNQCGIPKSSLDYHLQYVGEASTILYAYVACLYPTICNCLIVIACHGGVVERRAIICTVKVALQLVNNEGHRFG